MDLFSGDEESDEEVVVVAPKEQKARLRLNWSSERLRLLFPEQFAPVFISDALDLAENLDGIGGGRGFVASRDVEPGELLLVEKPLWRRLSSPEEEARGMAEACSADAELARAVRRVYPVGESTAAQRLRDVWRLSAFETGLYIYQSLFNDSPEAPCVQLHVAEDDRDEVWATRFVRKGQAMTLSYVQPADASLPRRAQILQHHGFLQSGEDEASDERVDELEADMDLIEEVLISDAEDEDTLEAALKIKARLNDSDDEVIRRRAYGILARVADSVKGRNDVAFEAATMWLESLKRDPNRGIFYPDVSQAAGIAADALSTRMQMANESDVSNELEEKELLLELRSLSAKVRDTYDSRRWLF